MFTEADTITDEEIISIAQRLTDEGRPVTPVTVWSELRRGSAVSIAAALQRWRDARQPAMPAAQLPAEMPHEFADALMHAAHRIRKASWDDAHSAIAKLTDSLSQRLQTALAERDEALAVYQTAEGAAADLRRQHDDLTRGLRASEETVSRLQAQLAGATERAEASQARAAELAERTSTQDAVLAAARMSLDEERKAREALKAEVTAKSEEIGRIARERDEAREESAAKSQQAEQVSQESAARIAALEAELQAARAELATEREASTARDADASARDEELQRVKRELDEARVQDDGSRARVAALEAELATDHEANAARHAEASAREEALQRANRELEEARVQIDESRSRVAALEAELVTEREANAAHGVQASAGQEALVRITRELDEARAQLHAAHEEKSAAQAELARVSQDATAAATRADEAQQQAARLAEQLAERENSEAAMRDELRDHKIALQTAGAAKEEELAALQRRISTQAQTHAKAYDELRSNAEQWVTYARDLKQRLDVANEKILFIDARSTGEVALLRRLSTELERLKPDHELVLREAQQRVIGDKIAQQLAQKGYRYDPATAVMSKIEG
ncbi:DNA-binding protein [Caballeronia grimmiae]|uniref:DNA-binding protein n=1 Tax=Caballeronia grimmiae TaxID=1071679 RepID=UPI0038B75320